MTWPLGAEETLISYVMIAGWSTSSEAKSMDAAGRESRLRGFPTRGVMFSRKCSFCESPIAEDAPLVTAAGSSHRICGDCVTLCSEVLEQASARPQEPWDVSCSFCGAHHRDVERMVAAPTLYICNRCVTSVAGALR